MSVTSDWREVLRAERDRGFREHVEDLTARGLRAVGVIGPSAVVLYLLLHLIRGRTFALAWGHTGDLVIWDKLAILVLSALLGSLSGTAFARRHGRWLAVAVSLLASLASMADDLGSGDASFSSAWLALFLVVAAFAVPLNPRQMGVLSVSTVAAFLVPVSVSELPNTTFVINQLVFLASIGLCVQGFSMMLYRTRFAQYKARERAGRLSEELAEKADRLEKLERMKSQFFTGITHDIRTPLSLVLGPINDLLGGHSGSLDDETRRPLAIARRNAVRLRELTEDLLDLSRIEAGHLFLDLRPHDVGDLVERCVVDLQPLAERQNVALGLDATESAFIARIDPDRMAQVVQNLIGNAIAHTPSGGSVRVEMDRGDASCIRIRIRDTGAGIESEHLPHLFDRFYRAKGSVDRPGYGLGLAIANELTVLHGGRIEVASEPGVGSTFDILLPVTSDAAESLPALPGVVSLPEREAVPVPDTASTDRLPHVLVVDDNPDMRDYLRLHLDGRYRLSEASRGDDALTMIRDHQPDLVISDVMMPGMDGFDLCRAVRSDDSTRTLPFVLITARGDAAARVTGLEAGADDFLLKPFDADALVARLENLIELRRLLRGSGTIGPTEIEVDSADKVFVERVRAVVEDHLGDTNFGVEWLADEVGLSARQLQRRLRDATRLTAAGFIRMMRLGRAAQLLAAGATNVSETAYEVGFRDADHFSRLFRQTHGVPPSEYVRMYASGS